MFHVKHRKINLMFHVKHIFNLLAYFIKIIYITISATIMFEPGQSWKTAALKASNCVRFFMEDLWKNI